MSSLHTLIKKASGSSFYKWLLNRAVSWAVPFNAPHHFKILEINPGFVKIRLPYRRSNLNHVKGIHACALATLCEFTVGLALVSKLGEKEYRIILKNISLEYHYQAKMDVFATYELREPFLSEQILKPLESLDAIFKEFEIKVIDNANNQICTGLINWQIKKWDKVRHPAI